MFNLKVYGIFSSQTKPTVLALKDEVLTTGLPGKSI